MMCKNPYVKVSDGRICKLDLARSESARLASTPFPCGQCMPCLINKARLWTIRILLEGYAWPKNSFLTLTYDDRNLSADGNLNKRHYQLFLKNLRYRYSPEHFRFFGIGEYGSESWRPHYHFILFNFGFEDSRLIEKSWDKGFSFLGELNKYTARYITGYVTKKMTHRNHPNLNGKEPEFMTCSRHNGGIGYSGLVKIRNALDRYGLDDYVDKIRIDRKEVFLGRYLTEKVNQNNKNYEDQKEGRFYDYQERQFEKYWDDGNIRYNIRTIEADAVRAREKKYSIYKQRKTL